MDILTLTPQHMMWEQAADFAAACSWRAGPYLAKLMHTDGFSGWERVFAAVENGKIMGYCTLMTQDCVPDVDYSPYIGFMFVGERYRGARLSEQLIWAALGYAKTLGFSDIYLVSGERGLYEKYGFRKLEERPDAWGNMEQIFMISI